MHGTGREPLLFLVTKGSRSHNKELQRDRRQLMGAWRGFSGAKNLDLSLVPQDLTSFLFGFLLLAVTWGADSSCLPGFVRVSAINTGSKHQGVKGKLSFIQIRNC